MNVPDSAYELVGKFGSKKTQIDATDRAIDALVYKLYDLTPEEIAIVEGCDI